MGFEDKKYIPVRPRDVSPDSMLGKYMSWEPQREDYELAGKLALGATVPYAAVYGFKHTPAARILMNRAMQLSTKIEGFYDKGVTAKNKMSLGWERFKLGRMGDVDKFIQKYPNEFSPDMDLKAKRAQVDKFIKQQGLNKPAELLALADMEKAEIAATLKTTLNPDEDWIVHQYGSKKRLLRHEKLMTENIKMIMGEAPDIDVLRQNGLSAPVKTDIKRLFKGHEFAAEKWGAWSDKHITASNVLDTGSDRSALLSSAKRDPQFAMARDVANSTADLNNPAEVRAAAKNSLNKFDWGKSVPKSMRHHSYVRSAAEVEEILESFMKNYRVDGKRISINFSPQYKPHILMGGVNADVNFVRKESRKVRILKKHKKAFTSGDLGKLKSHGSKYSLLISDDYDMFSKISKLIQKWTHFNFAHESGVSSSSYMEGYGTKATFKKEASHLERTPRRTKFKKAVKSREAKEIARQARKLSNKGVRAITRVAKLIY